MLQIVAPPTHRARLLSLFQLGLGGGGPIGAFIAGTTASAMGVNLRVAAALAMMLLIALVLAFSSLWTMSTVERPAGQSGHDTEQDLRRAHHLGDCRVSCAAWPWRR